LTATIQIPSWLPSCAALYIRTPEWELGVPIKAKQSIDLILLRTFVFTELGNLPKITGGLVPGSFGTLYQFRAPA
jgi:hypothetical protein